MDGLVARLQYTRDTSYGVRVGSSGLNGSQP
jgi:hypothetical protein